MYSEDKPYCHVNEILHPSFWEEMFAEYPRMKKHWGLKVIMGKHFDHTETRYKESVPSSTDYIVYKFQKTSGVNSFLRLFQCKFDDGCHRVI